MESKYRRILASGGILLLAGAFDLVLLRPLLISSTLDPQETRRAYYEPQPEGIEVMLDRQHAGYITDLEVDGADLEIPAGRTVAIPLRQGAEIVLRTLATDLAPYIVFGSEDRASNLVNATRLADASVFDVRTGALEARPWNISRPWVEDKQWLRDLHTRCNLRSRAEASIRTDADVISIRLGSCVGKVRLPAGSSHSPLVLVVTGPHAAVASSLDRDWQQSWRIRWTLLALVVLRVLLFSFVVGVVPTTLISGALFAMGQLSRTAAILTWAATLPIVVAAVMALLVARLVPRRIGLACLIGAFVLALEICGSLAAIAFLDVGTFGHERITREGNSHCSIVGYSTVRGDSLRRGTDGIVERLNDECTDCRNRTSRFSREAQTLRWVREVVCSPSFPAPTGGEVIFLGGGNDDLFYRPTGLFQLLADFAGTLRFVVQPPGATDWEAVFDLANQRIVPTLDEQAADIEAIVNCASQGGRRFHFVHDFLIWDLDRGRTPARQLMFERRRDAVRSAGGQFVDLLEAFHRTAGVAWLNDFIHPSAVGQQMIADLLCDRLATQE